MGDGGSGGMVLSEAISEFAYMLAAGSEALERLSKRDAYADVGENVTRLLVEVQDIAQRLAAISEELKREV